MRVAIVDWSSLGVVSEVTVRLANELAEHVDVHVFVPSGIECPAGTGGDWTRHALVPISVSGPSWRRVLTQANPLIHAANAKRIRRVAPDIVHFTALHPANAMLVPLLSAPTCLTVTGIEPLSTRGGRFREEMRRRTVMIADQLVVESRAVRDALLLEGLPPDGVPLIPLAHEAFVQQHLSLYHRLTEQMPWSGWALLGR